MQKQYKMIYLIFICFAIAESDYVKIFQGKDVIGQGKGYQNTEWSLDSKVFTIEMHMDSIAQNKTFKLYVGNVDELENFSELISESSKKTKRFGKLEKVRERNLGWVGEYIFYGTMDRSDKIRECSLDGDYFEMYPVDEFEDQVEELVDLELVFPLREYTMSKNNIYFTTSSDPRRVWLLNELDGDYTYSILAYGDEESKRLFDIPIVSLSASLNDDRILLVSYNENQSEIIMLDKDDENLSTREIKKYKKTNIKKPDSDQMNYLYGILDPQNSNRYLLIARSQTSKTSENKNLAKVFVMNSDSPNGREGEFTMYRSMELLLVYNNPEIQFHPLTGDIYFIDDVKHNKKLAYWDGEKTNLASLNLDNIMNFKFSPDGKYLLATTFDPNDLYLYEVTE